jgi:hypothetical protein
VTGLPTNGATLYVRLFSATGPNFSGATYNDYTYTASGTPVPAVLTSPTPGTKLSGSSVMFTWTAGSGVSTYGLWLGSAVYARMWSMINGVWQSNDYTYTASGP